MLQISSSAVKEIERIKRNREQPDVQIKLTISLGGCSGLYYELKLENLDSQSNKDDFQGETSSGYNLVKIEGIEIAIDSRYSEYIEKLTIDYAQDLMGGGFRFHNPQAKNVCGCGISFAIA
ncbi:MAG: iron-sulfur cluster assembly accessory protein [Cyanobacteria bacterium P01_G01_bin.19]